MVAGVMEVDYYVTSRAKLLKQNIQRLKPIIWEDRAQLRYCAGQLTTDGSSNCRREIARA